MKKYTSRIVTKRMISLPLWLWPRVIKYYVKRIFHLPVTEIESNWIYFLSLASLSDIHISKGFNEYVISNTAFDHKVSIRRGKSSDILVYLQIYFHMEYKPLTTGHIGKNENSVIIDAGANVGFFALYSNKLFPGSKIICVEPDQLNCVQIIRQKEINHLENLIIEQSALWDRSTALDLMKGLDNLEWNYSVSENINGHVNAITLHELMQKYNIDHIDIFKIDIEGAEERLFSDSSFLNLVGTKVKSLAIEFHSNLSGVLIKDQLILLGFDLHKVDNLLFAFKK